MSPPRPVIPGDIPDERMPSLLRNWFLGSKAKRWLSTRRYLEVTGLAGDGPGRALDVGCGWGYALFLLERRGWRPVGIDIVQDDFFAARAIAAANGGKARIAGADVSALPFRPGSFDVVTTVETIEHIYEPDRRRAVREMRAVLSPGGRLVCSTPNYHSLVEAGKRLLVRFPRLKRLCPPMCYPAGVVSRSAYHPYSYHRPVPAGQLVGLLEEEGFEVATVKRIIFVWKNVPDALFPLCRLAEALLERLPLIRCLASTLVVAAVKR
ncbi:MAG: class I SAM-dependent methyltransferase [Candidatus Krumholzibacteriota bacterium]|nr:class I SAM-dependent methyltransferase [Candidatus Krumholzibacteriota bacterium]